MSKPRKDSQAAHPPGGNTPGVLCPVLNADREHNRFSPSASARWLSCIGSTILCEKLPEDDKVASDKPNDTDLGSAAHALLNHCLETKTHPEQYRGRKVWSHLYTVDDDMIDAVDHALDYVWGLISMRGPDAKLLLERKVAIPGVTSGHLDVAIVLGDNIDVIDYKHGAGVPVSAEKNTQLGLYALGLLEEISFKQFKQPKVILHVVQPRCSRRASPADDWHAPAKWLQWLLATAKQAVDMVTHVSPVPGTNVDVGDELPFTPSEKSCKWCKAKAHCPALARTSFENARQDFAEVIAGNPKQLTKADATAGLTPDEMAKAFAALPMVYLFADALTARVTAMLMAGEKVGDLKVVEGKSNRRWIDESTTMAYLIKLGIPEDKVAPRSLIGIGEAEKLLPKDKRADVMKKLAGKPEGKPTVANGDDPRPSIARNARNDFVDDIQDELLG